MKNPCKDCGIREIGCHSECKEYTEWKEWRREKNEDQRNAIGYSGPLSTAKMKTYGLDIAYSTRKIF